MSFKYKSGGQVSDSVGLLVSILVRYPEVGTVNVEQDDQILRLTFFLFKGINSIEDHRETIIDSLQLFNQFEGRVCRVCDLSLHLEEGLISIEVKRDIETFTQNELNLIVDLLSQFFPDSLVADPSEDMPEEELLMQEEMIRHMLDNIRSKRLDKNVVALREDGRVLVFNK
ncbi:MAG: hypothetical protein M0Z55_06205 [Peptococcaceae bacterium]|nr:hypothetical protein [Peptococcaceae bacterium]